jgi:hypothetical protein
MRYSKFIKVSIFKRSQRPGGAAIMSMDSLGSRQRPVQSSQPRKKYILRLDADRADKRETIVRYLQDRDSENSSVVGHS